MVAPQPFPLAVQVDLTPLITKLETLQTDLSTKVGEVRGKVDDVGTRVGTVIGALTDIDKSVDNTENIISQSSQKIAQIETAIGPIRAEVSGIAADINIDNPTVGPIGKSTHFIVGAMEGFALLRGILEGTVIPKLDEILSKVSDGNIKRLETKLDDVLTLTGRLHFETLILPLSSSQTEAASMSQLLDSKFNVRSIEDLANWRIDAAAAEQQIQKYYDDNKLGFKSPSAVIIDSVRAKARTIVGYTSATQKKKS